MPPNFPNIPGYEIKARVAAGAMGTVYEAVQLSLGARRAIKIIHPHLADDADFLARFELEARSAAVLDNAHIVKVIEFSRQNDPPYLSMEYVDGSTLADVLKTVRPVPRDVALLVLADVANGLESAHAEGVLHRDIKPSNIMFSTAGVAKIADFGLAKSREASSTLSSTDQAVGTPAYMAPEHIAGGHVDARADLFALGIVAYELMAGERPFAGTTSPAVQTAILRDEPAPLHERNPLVSRDLSEFVHQLLAKDPDARPRDAAAVRQWLDRYIEQSAIAGRTQLLARFATDPDGVAFSLREKEIQSNLYRAHNLMALGEQKARDALQVLSTVLHLNPRLPEALEMKHELIRILASQNVHDLREVLSDGAARVIEESGPAASGATAPDTGFVETSTDGQVAGHGAGGGHDAGGDDDVTMMRPRVPSDSTTPSNRAPAPTPPSPKPPIDDLDATQRAVPTMPLPPADASPPAKPGTPAKPATPAEPASPTTPASAATPTKPASPQKPVAPTSPKRPTPPTEPPPIDTGGGVSGRKVVIGFLALAAVLLIGYAIVSFGFAKGTIHLTELDPPDATVVVVETDDPLSPTSPFVTLPTGQYTIRASRSGFASTEREVEVVRGASVDIPPLVLTPQGATLTIDGGPPGALVSVDGRELGRMPIRDALVPLQGTESASVEITVSLEGYEPETRSVRLRPGGSHVEEIDLVERGQGRFAGASGADRDVTSIDTAHDDTRAATPIDELASDASASDELASEAPASDAPESDRPASDASASDESADAVRTVEKPSTPCVARITVTSGGNDLILVDGEEFTRDGLALRTPQRDIELPCGAHEVSVSRDGKLGSPATHTVTLRAGDSKHIRFDFGSQ